MTVKLHEVVTRMMDAAKVEKDDKMSNILCRIADRLSQIGTPYAGYFDGPLTPTELKIIRRFIRA
ncbi:hypothetical protein UFOVP395_111 [uncultured Caudovirales phage]|jgi:hypothetical protein|uniref:Uncharacterized protein n=1 Tax=uncultured Caudovirales phage TaxID=2100421 RepID=A0A6J5M6J7_9CAUD|nr:hypothetical protein UFOVP395_111 [uncultured Caudovirales phage]